MGLSVGLDSAVKALRSHQLAVDVASHNIANAQTPGFSRQRVLLRPVGIDGTAAYGRDALLGRVGMGVDASDVNRVRDIFLDFQVRATMGSGAYHGALSDALARTEIVFNDPTDDGISGIIANFWAAWHDVVNDPESAAARTSVLHASSTLAARIQGAYGHLRDQRADLNLSITNAAEEINRRADEIASLNLQIKQVELNGDSANDLRDRRDVLLDEVSKIVQISYAEQEDGTITVYAGGQELVLSNMARHVETVSIVGDPGMKKLVWSLSGDDVIAGESELGGLYEARDTAIPGLLAKLDAFASALITQVNAVHSVGFGLDNSTGLAFFTGTDASDIAVNAVLEASPEKLAVAGAIDSPGSGTNALAIANLQQALTMAGGTQTFEEFYSNIVTTVGADARRAAGIAESSSLMTSHLDGLRMATSGVNLDEEMTNLAASQRAYEAAARVITAIDQMLETLINRTGVAGR